MPSGGPHSPCEDRDGKLLLRVRDSWVFLPTSVAKPQEPDSVLLGWGLQNGKPPLLVGRYIGAASSESNLVTSVTCFRIQLGSDHILVPQLLPSGSEPPRCSPPLTSPCSMLVPQSLFSTHIQSIFKQRTDHVTCLSQIPPILTRSHRALYHLALATLGLLAVP